jgi:hypothetical protein
MSVVVKYVLFIVKFSLLQMSLMLLKFAHFVFMDTHLPLLIQNLP